MEAKPRPVSRPKPFGILVPDGAPPERALVAGTGLDVFEVYKLFLAVERNWQRLRSGFDWLTDEQLRGALDYAAAHEAAMESRLSVEDRADERLKSLWRSHPSSAPAKTT